MPEPYRGKVHQPAALPYIGRGDSTERLYMAEQRVVDHINSVAHHMARLLKHEPEQLWSHSMVEALAAMLDHYSPSTAIAAATGYLNSKGFTVTPPAPEEKHLNGKGESTAT